MSPTELEQRESSEEIQILDWRFEQLLRVGYERRQAHVLSHRVEVDLHQAVDLVLNGCSPELAFKILR